MLQKKKKLVFVPTLVLVALFLAMTPLKLFNKMAHISPCAHSQSKQEIDHKKCFSPSLVSQNDFDAAVTDTNASYAEVSYWLKDFHALPESFPSKIHIDSIPLRC